MRAHVAVGMLLLVASVVTASVADPSASEAVLPSGYRVVQRWPPPAAGWQPIAAVRLDRDRDGDADVAVLYRGDGAGLVAWIAVRGSAAGDVDRVVTLDFAPAALAAADFDGDGREELAIGEAEAAAVRTFAVTSDGRLEAGKRFALPGIAARLEAADRPRDGVMDLVVELQPGAKSARPRWVIGSPAGVTAALAARSWRRDAVAEPPAERPSAELLATRLDADAHLDVLLALDDGEVALAKLAIEAVIAVNSTSEAVDFGGAQQVGDLPGPDGLVTLREAIIAANNTAGADVVEFNIPTAGNDCHDGACWFTPSDGELGRLPTITDPAGITLDGYTQTDQPRRHQPQRSRAGARRRRPDRRRWPALPGPGQRRSHRLRDPPLHRHAIHTNDDADGLVVKGCYLGTSLDGTSAVSNFGGSFWRRAPPAPSSAAPAITARARWCPTATCLGNWRLWRLRRAGCYRPHDPRQSNRHDARRPGGPGHADGRLHRPRAPTPMPSAAAAREPAT